MLGTGSDVMLGTDSVCMLGTESEGVLGTVFVCRVRLLLVNVVYVCIGFALVNIVGPRCEFLYSWV